MQRVEEEGGEMKTEIEHCMHFDPQTMARTEKCPRKKDYFDEYVSIISKCVGKYEDLPCKYYEE